MFQSAWKVEVANAHLGTCTPVANHRDINEGAVVRRLIVKDYPVITAGCDLVTQVQQAWAWVGKTKSNATVLAAAHDGAPLNLIESAVWQELVWSNYLNKKEGIANERARCLLGDEHA